MASCRARRPAEDTFLARLVSKTPQISKRQAAWLALHMAKRTSAMQGEPTGNYLFELGTSGFFVPRGFVRAKDGTITVNIDPANTFSSNPGAINPNGTIAGYYQDDITGAWHFFLRSKHGVFTTFDIPGTRQIFFATFNQGETVTGTYPDSSFVIHSFLRTAHGAITVIDAPGAGTSFFQGTFVNSINPAGRITGHYTDTNYVAHGFVWSK